MMLVMMMMVMIAEIRESEEGMMWAELRVLISNDDDIMIRRWYEMGKEKTEVEISLQCG